jgi:hypothetical protein
VVCQVLKNTERPSEIGAPIAEKSSFLDAFHVRASASLMRKDRIEIPRIAAFS